DESGKKTFHKSFDEKGPKLLLAALKIREILGGSIRIIGLLW
ncbi:4928_t:CDS:1, partial [Funneliformis caledonium]